MCIRDRYKPEEIQKYVYYLEDNPEVFWIHFTGSDVKNILAYHGISLDEHVFYCGVLPDYKALFRKIIQELQLCRYGYEDYIASLFNDILLLVDRQQHEQKKATGNVQEQIERATAYFNENYNTKISIDDYAESLHISTNWFIHNFKQYAGMSPAQYILSLRMVNAQSLLERTTYNIKEISEIVGYDGKLTTDDYVALLGRLDDFRKIIQELQLCRYGYEDYIASLFNDILLLVDRQQHEQKKATGNVQEQIERAAAYFNENYNTKISIDDYAESLHISTNWFIHNFKQYAGMSPAQYILSLRMVNAQSLLERTTYNIKEISEIVGYENPLYFSRVFKKEIGKSPAQYRKERVEAEEVEK